MTADLRRWVRAAGASITFLTLLPVGRALEFDGDDVARGAPLFPVAGALLGAVAGVVDWQLGGVAPALLTGVIVALLAIGATGALHIDGLADFADGFGGRTPQERLRIMRDSRIGTYGACALGFDIAIRVAAYATMAGQAGQIWIVVSAGALSRAAGPPLAAVSRYAQPASGKGSPLRAMGAPGTVALTVALAAGITVAAVGARAAIAIPVAAISFAIVGRSSHRRLGGITGDTAGAAIELSELAILATLASLR
jgi:adenosylcobinamide-GDP ribazoletransferase